MESDRNKKNTWFDWYDSLVFALAVIVILSVFGMRMVTVSGTSMMPTLHPGDRLAVQSMINHPQRGDIIITDGFTVYGDPLAKRVIGIGGDTVDIDFDAGVVYCNGKALEEPYISAPTTVGFDVGFPVIVPEDCLFVMGDNRPNSLDSRSSHVGFISEKDILGKVLFRVLPLNRAGKTA